MWVMIRNEFGAMAKTNQHLSSTMALRRRKILQENTFLFLGNVHMLNKHYTSTATYKINLLHNNRVLQIRIITGCDFLVKTKAITKGIN